MGKSKDTRLQTDSVTVLLGTWITGCSEGPCPLLKIRLHVEGSRDPGARVPVVVRPGAQGPRLLAGQFRASRASCRPGSGGAGVAGRAAVSVLPAEPRYIAGSKRLCGDHSPPP